MKKKVILTCLFILSIYPFMAQKTTYSLFDNIDKIIKNNNEHYMIIPHFEKKPVELEFIVFDSISEKRNTKLLFILAPTSRYIIHKGGPVWFVMKDSLFIHCEYNSEDKAINYFLGKKTGLYGFFNLNSFFASGVKPIAEGTLFINSPLPVIKEDVFLNRKFPRPENGIVSYDDVVHTWYDLLHTKQSLTLFTSIHDTTVIVKDIDLSVVPKLKYSMRSQFYHIPNLKEFKVFRIKSNDYLVSDSGKVFFIPPKEDVIQYRTDRLGNEFVLREDRYPVQVGYLQYEEEKNLFYFVDNDKDEVSFNCPFVSSSEEYEGLIGYIDSTHWLYKQYYKIREKYLKEGNIKQKSKNKEKK